FLKSSTEKLFSAATGTHEDRYQYADRYEVRRLAAIQNGCEGAADLAILPREAFDLPIAEAVDRETGYPGSVGPDELDPRQLESR
ncbi:MAG: hypothetical protein AAF202_06225, partial [Pseudomonadota bacterium]